MRAGWIVPAVIVGLVLIGFYFAFEVLLPQGSKKRDEVLKTPARERASRRLYEGAPPVVPHLALGAACTSCHHEEGLEVPGLGYAPPSPHEFTPGLSATSLCTQCHVYKTTDDVFVANTFVGLPQDLRKGRRLNPLSPPVIPHLVQMRENCLACHSGPAAREEIRTTHSERRRCTQCHLETASNKIFKRRSPLRYPG